MSTKKKLSEMTLDEQIEFYQKKAADAKAKKVKKANERYMLIGKIACEVFEDVPEDDSRIKAYFTKMADALKAKSENTSDTNATNADIQGLVRNQSVAPNGTYQNRFGNQ